MISGKVKLLLIDALQVIIYKLTMFLLFISSSIGFFFGMTRLVRPRCNAASILPNICSTSSDVLKMSLKANKIRLSFVISAYSLKIIGTVYIVNVMYCLL